MSHAIPIGVPAQIVSGDTLEFDYSNSDFPVADGWALSFVLRGPQDLASEAGQITTQGDTYKVKIPAASVKLAVTGRSTTYGWALYFTKGSDRVTAATGSTEVLRNPSAAINEKSHNERMLEVIKATLEGRTIADVESYQIDGRAVNNIPYEQLLKARDKYARLVRRDRNPGRLGRSVEVGFVAP